MIIFIQAQEGGSGLNMAVNPPAGEAVLTFTQAWQLCPSAGYNLGHKQGTLGDPLSVTSDSDSDPEEARMTCLTDMLEARRPRWSDSGAKGGSGFLERDFTRIIYHVEQVTVGNSGQETAKTLSKT